MGYNLFTQILILPAPQGSFYYISLSSYSKLSKSLAQLFADKHMFTYKTDIEVLFLQGMFNVMSSEITFRAVISSFLHFSVLLLFHWL